MTFYDSKRKRIRVRPMEGQRVLKLWVSYSRKQRNQIIIGITFRKDVKLIEPDNRKPYFVPTKKILGKLSSF